MLLLPILASLPCCCLLFVRICFSLGDCLYANQCLRKCSAIIQHGLQLINNVLEGFKLWTVDDTQQFSVCFVPVVCLLVPPPWNQSGPIDLLDVDG